MPIKTLRPSAEAFRRAGWLPASNKVYKEWMDELTKRIRLVPFGAAEALLPPVQQFKDYIETDATVYQEFIRMFEGVTEAVCCSDFKYVCSNEFTSLLTMLNCLP